MISIEKAVLVSCVFQTNKSIDSNPLVTQVADKFMKLISGKKPETCKLIVSSHNFENTPSTEELENLVAQIQATGADIVKIATTATEIVDVAKMFQILVHCQVSLPSDSIKVLYPYVLVSWYLFLVLRI